MDLLNPTTGQIEVYRDEDLTPEVMKGLAARGLRPASAEDVAARAEYLKRSTTGQQALGLGEAAVRGATLGFVEGVGPEEEIRQRAAVLGEESPVLAGAAEFAPDVALGLLTGGASALATTAGRAAAKGALKGGIRASLGAAAKAAPKAALIGEALGGGAVAASQEAFAEGRDFLDDPIEDAKNLLFWAGLGGTIGGAPGAFRAAKRKLGKAGKAAAELADEAELSAAFRQGEERVLPETAIEDPAAASPVDLSGKSLEDLKALALDQGAKQETLTALRGSSGFAEDFATTGRVKEFGPNQGIQIEMGPAGPRLRDGRHRLTVAREQGRETVFGQVFEGVRKPGKAPIYEGEIRIAPPKASGKTGAEQAAEKGVTKAERAATRAEADDIVDRVARGDEPVREASGFARDSRLAQHRDEILETATKESRNDLNELNRLSQGIRERAIKQEDVAKNIGQNLPAQQTKARDIALKGQRLAGEIRADAHALAAQLGKKNAQYFSGTARDLVGSLVERTKAISKMTDGAQIFNALDDLKRIVDNHKVALEQGSRTSAKDPLSYQNLIPKVESFAHEIRASLEDVGTFGRAGEMQKAYNATYHEKWFPALKVFEESVFKATGRDYRAFSTLDAWESKITNLLQTPGGGERRHVVDMLGALKEMAEQRAKYGTASAKETGRIVELVDKLNRTFGLADETLAASKRMEGAKNVLTGFGGAIGGVLGGLPGAVLGGGVAKVGGELATGRFRNAFRSMQSATTGAIERSVDDWIQTSKTRGGLKLPGVRLPRLRPEDAVALATARRRGTTVGFSEFMGEDDDPQSAYAAKRDALFDDEAFVGRFSEEFGELAAENPAAYTIAAGKAAEVRKFLVDRLPANMALSMMRPNGYPPTNESIEDWSVYYNAATNPRSVFASLARGDIRPQEVETLRTLHTPLYDQLQATVLDRITSATQSGEELDDQFVMRMNLLFDLDGAGSPAFSQRAATAARQAQQQTPAAQARGGSFAPKAASRVQPSNVAMTGPTYGTAG